MQRKVIKPANFTDVAALEQRLLGFEKRYNDTAKHFGWRYTKAYLDRLATPRATHRGQTPKD